MDDRILLDAGSGGRASQRLISQCFMRHFSNPLLDRMDDAALLDIKGPLAMSTDSYTVTPLFFAGGSIGTLAVHGTVNDVAMLGARPRYLSCACIIEEGLELSILDRVVADMAAAAQTAGVHIVTGDTKVVPRGMCDKIFINTTGVGEIFASPVPSGHAARPGDAVLVSGALGDHGLTVMGSREGLSFLTDVASDSAPLNHMIADIITACGEVHVLRDPTRGGLATTLNEIAEQSSVCIDIEESLLPVHESVRNGCSFLGLDPLYLANEGKCICILPQDKAEAALRAMQASPYGKEAAIIGRVAEDGKPGAPENAGERRANLDFAKAKVQAWQDRHKPRLSRAEKQETADEAQPSAALPDDEQTTVHGNANDMAQEPANLTPPEPSGIPVTQLQKRLGLLMPASRRYGHPDSNEQSNDQKEEKHHEQNS